MTIHGKMDGAKEERRWLSYNGDFPRSKATFGQICVGAVQTLPYGLRNLLRFGAMQEWGSICPNFVYSGVGALGDISILNIPVLAVAILGNTVILK